MESANLPEATRGPQDGFAARMLRRSKPSQPAGLGPLLESRSSPIPAVATWATALAACGSVRPRGRKHLGSHVGARGAGSLDCRRGSPAPRCSWSAHSAQGRRCRRASSVSTIRRGHSTDPSTCTSAGAAVPSRRSRSRAERSWPSSTAPSPTVCPSSFGSRAARRPCQRGSSALSSASRGSQVFPGIGASAGSRSARAAASLPPS